MINEREFGACPHCGRNDGVIEHRVWWRTHGGFVGPTELTPKSRALCEEIGVRDFTEVSGFGNNDP
jgi:hypothetical protein